MKDKRSQNSSHYVAFITFLKCTQAKPLSTNHGQQHTENSVAACIPGSKVLTWYGDLHL